MSVTPSSRPAPATWAPPWHQIPDALCPQPVLVWWVRWGRLLKPGGGQPPVDGAVGGRAEAGQGMEEDALHQRAAHQAEASVLCSSFLFPFPLLDGTEC